MCVYCVANYSEVQIPHKLLPVRKFHRSIYKGGKKEGKRHQRRDQRRKKWKGSNNIKVLSHIKNPGNKRQNRNKNQFYGGETFL